MRANSGAHPTIQPTGAPRQNDTAPNDTAPIEAPVAPRISPDAVPAATPPNRTRAWLLRIAGTLIFAVLLVWLDLRGDLPLDKVWDVLRSANLLLLALSIALYVPFLGIKAARWRLVSGAMRMPLSWGDALRIYSIGLAAGTFTPGQAGDALKAWYVQRRGYTLAGGLGSSVLDRLFDVAGLAVLGLIGVFVFGGKFANQTPVLVAWVALCLVAVAFIAWNRTRTWAVKLVMRRLSRIKSREQDTSGGQSADWSLNRATLVQAALLTVASFAVSVFRVWLIAAAIGVVLGPWEVLGFVGLTTAAALVPVTVGGVGTRDAIAVLAFQQIGLAAAQGLATSLLILVLNVTQAIIGWVVWLGYKAETGSKT